MAHPHATSVGLDLGLSKRWIKYVLPKHHVSPSHADGKHYYSKHYFECSDCGDGFATERARDQVRPF